MNPNETQEALRKAVTDYSHNSTPQAVLDPFKESILTLRAKFASYEIVTEMLVQHGIQVSIATVRRFCRRHNPEMKRIRTGLLTDKRTAASGPSGKGPDLAPPGTIVPFKENSPAPKLPRDLRGPV